MLSLTLGLGEKTTLQFDAYTRTGGILIPSRELNEEAFRGESRDASMSLPLCQFREFTLTRARNSSPMLAEEKERQRRSPRHEEARLTGW